MSEEFRDLEILSLSPICFWKGNKSLGDFPDCSCHSCDGYNDCCKTYLSRLDFEVARKLREEYGNGSAA